MADPADHGSPFVGRHRELDVISRFVGSLAAGRGGVLVVEAEAGLGKTRLLEELRLIADGGVRGHVGRCTELDTGRPFGPLIGALDLRVTASDPVAAGIGRLLDQRRTAGLFESGDEWRVSDAILDYIERAGEAAPQLVAIDDLQWSDPSTLRTVEALAEMAGQVALGVTLALRPTPRSDLLDALLGRVIALGATRLSLSALAPDEVSGLLAGVAGARPGPRLTRLAQGAAGNPLFVVQLVASLRAEGRLTVTPVAEVSQEAIPVTLRSTVEHRLHRLAPPTVELLRVGSVLGPTFSLDQLAAITGETPLDIAARLRPAFLDGLLDDDDGAVAFRHDLVREAVYASLPAAERTERHHEIGRRLAAMHAPPAHVAEHLAVGAQPGDGEAVRWLRKAGLAAAAHDASTAVGYLERALALSSRADPRRRGLVSELVAQLVLVGRDGDAERHARAVLAQVSEPGVETLLRVGLGNVLVRSGRPDEARAEYLRAAAVAGGDRVGLAAAAAARAMAVLAGNIDVALADLPGTMAAAEGARDGFAQAMAGKALCAARAGVGDVQGAVDIGCQSVLVASDVEHFFGAFLFPHIFLAPVLLAMDRIGESRAGLQAARWRSSGGPGSCCPRTTACSRCATTWKATGTMRRRWEPTPPGFTARRADGASPGFPPPPSRCWSPRPATSWQPSCTTAGQR